MSDGHRPAEFDFPLSWSGPDGIGASPFDEFAGEEAPDVGGDDPPSPCARRSGSSRRG